jgi:hypothetical protein
LQLRATAKPGKARSGVVKWTGPDSVNHRSKSLIFLVFASGMFHRQGGDETFGAANETIFRLQCRTPETADGYQATNKRRRKSPESVSETVKCAP